MSYFIDVQGTLLDDIRREPIIGAIEFIDTLNLKAIPYVIVTNNTKKRSEDFHSFLQAAGFDVPMANYLDPFMVLQNRVLTKDIYAFGPREFLEVLSSMGFNNTQNPKAILIASDKNFDSDDYALMIELVQQGAQLIGMHATSIYAKDGRSYPGVGAILEMISYATGCEYDIIGKPSIPYYERALELLNAQQSGHTFADITMISDDAIGDLCGIKALGAKSVLVLSGKCKSEKDILHVRSSIDKIVTNIGSVYE